MADRTRRGQRGRGSVYYDAARERWVGQLTVGKKPSQGDPTRLVRDVVAIYASSEEEAWDKLDEVRRQHRTGLLPGSQSRTETVGDLLRRWLVGKRGTVVPTTWQRYEEHVRLHLLPHLGMVRLRELRAHHARTLYTALARRLGSRSIGYAHLTLRAAVKQAVTDGDLARDPLLGVKPPRLERPEQTALEQDAVRRLEVAADGLRLGALWLLAVYTGAREGELLGATWADVELTRRDGRPGGRWTIRRALVRGERSRLLIVPRTKRRASQRTLPIPPHVVTVLRAHKARQGAERLKAGPLWRDHDLVFCTERGTPYNPSNLLARDWKQLARAARLPVGTHPHTLRHTFASTLFALGRPLPEIAALLGHGSIMTTATVYAHYVARAPDDAILALATYYLPAGATGAGE